MAMINSQRLPEDTMTLNMLRVVNSDHRELEISLSHHLLFSMRLGEYSMSCLMVPRKKSCSVVCTVVRNAVDGFKVCFYWASCLDT